MLYERQDNMTEKLYDYDGYKTEFDAVVISCEKTDKGYKSEFSKTLFFPNEGGQKCDTGTVNGIEITNVEIEGDRIYHYSETAFEVGTKVSGKIDFAERYRKMQNHTGEHIICGIAHRLYGCENVGFHLGADYVTMDLDKPLSCEETKKIEILSNEAIYKNTDVTAYYPEKEELNKLVYRSKSEILENVRIVKIDGIDVCACCAPHVRKTGEVGIIKILDRISYKGGLRLTISCGFDAFKDYSERLKRNIYISNLLSVRQEEVGSAVDKLLEDISNLKNELGRKSEIITKLYVDSIDNSDESICLFAENLSNAEIRHIANAVKEKTPKIAAVFSGNDDSGYSYVISSKNIDLKEISKEINLALSGRGGGTSEMIQGNVLSSKKTIEKYLGL